MPEGDVGRCVVAVRFSELGDVAMSVPVLYSAAMSHPSVHFVMVTKTVDTDMFISPPVNLTVVGVNPKEYSGFGGARRLVARLVKEYDFDSFADLQDDSLTRYMRFWCRIKGGIAVRKIDLDKSGRHQLTRRRNKRMLPLVNERAQYRNVFYRLGLPVETVFVNLFDGMAPDSMYASVTAPKKTGETWIGIAPFARSKGKTYPPEQMEQVVKILLQSGAVKLFMFGGQHDDVHWLDEMSERYENVVSVPASGSGLALELALMSHLDVMLSMDSANMHMASLVDVPVVSIWGSTHPYCGFMGWRQRDCDALQLAMTCRPCSVSGESVCRRGDYYCLKGILPQMVVDRVNTVLNSRYSRV